MNKNIKNIKFTLTPNMSLELIKFNELKEKYLNLQKKYELNKSNETLIEMKKIEKQMTDCKINFVSEFKLTNKTQIKEYLNKGD